MAVNARRRSTAKNRASSDRQAKQNISPILMQWRFLTVLFSVVLVFFCLAARAAYIQVIEPDALIKQGDNRTIRVRDNPTYRGLITDRNGQQLAVSVPAKAIWADPMVVHAYDAETGSTEPLDERRFEALAKVLGKDVESIYTTVKNPKRRFAYLQRQVSPAMANFVEELAIPGIYLRNESKRYYPTGEVSPHVIGFTNVDDEGIEGIEKLYNDWLTGTPDKRKIRRDAKGRQVEIIEEQEGEKAGNLTLTIDQRIQALAYRELKEATLYYKAQSASVVIVDVHSGEILALANTPSYNPNDRSTVSNYRLRNRAITDAFEPGSSLKPLAVIAALEYGTATRDTIIDTSETMRLGGIYVRDGVNRGKLSLREVLKYSSNKGTSQLALSVDKTFLMDLYYNMGLMSDSGSNMIGESDGIFHERSRWSDHEIAALSFGYNISVTTMQLARMYATIANGGIKMPLSIIKSEEPALEAPERVISEETAYAVLEMMESVLEDDGSAKLARVPGYRVAGKTGTSKKAVAGGYGEEYVNIFAGVAPVSDPQIAVVVLINEPGGDLYHGGSTAAPTFSKITAGALQMLNIAPDDNDTLARVTTREQSND
ncbi:peptidoglycan glycosyltransferase FtsI [Glaciecola sp. MH2013]|uniref:peptidoglycan D,D-transpeptidase FtsI family protein n=1 Tax=Glaciecola sp. MH2013 TaxID=2785524 RepID=UPI00189F688B|nr:penicillin-binding transpeptidase domain-containing protein [Glaciecola sp. MH2013]MBF7072038.1 peptidoglycan glycosyltransferase FtsI [Glaciecola sp. MH2013]